MEFIFYLFFRTSIESFWGFMPYPGMKPWHYQNEFWSFFFNYMFWVINLKIYCVTDLLYNLKCKMDPVFQYDRIKSQILPILQLTLSRWQPLFSEKRKHIWVLPQLPAERLTILLALFSILLSFISLHRKFFFILLCLKLLSS